LENVPFTHTRNLNDPTLEVDFGIIGYKNYATRVNDACFGFHALNNHLNLKEFQVVHSIKRLSLGKLLFSRICKVTRHLREQKGTRRNRERSKPLENHEVRMIEQLSATL
jgi:hypothetical protein